MWEIFNSETVESFQQRGRRFDWIQTSSLISHHFISKYTMNCPPAAPVQADNRLNAIMMQTLRRYGYDLQHTEPVEDQEGVISTHILSLRDPKMDQTPFHLAVRKGHLDVLKALCKLPGLHDCLNQPDRHGNYALHFAASSSKSIAAEMTSLLLDHGADPTMLNKQNQTPLYTHLMLIKTDTADVTRVFTKQNHNLNDLVNGTTYLHMAASKRLMTIACALVAGGASINIPNGAGQMVSDTLRRKCLVKLIGSMKEGQQAAPKGAPRSVCKLCRMPPNLLESLHDCKLCGRCACRTCSKKAAEVKRSAEVEKEALSGRYCATCSTVLQLREMHMKNRADFQRRMFGYDT